MFPYNSMFPYNPIFPYNSIFPNNSIFPYNSISQTSLVLSDLRNTIFLSFLQSAVSFIYIVLPT